MKFSLALLATLAVSTSATPIPIRIITITSPDTFLPSEEVVASLPHPHSDDRPLPHRPPIVPTNQEAGPSRPCHGGPLGSLLSRLGLSASSPVIDSSFAEKGKDESDRSLNILEKWRSMVHDAEDTIVPILEGGIVKIIPSYTTVTNEDGESTPVNVHKSKNGDKTPEIKWWRPVRGGRGGWEVKDGQGEWRKPRRGEHPPRRSDRPQVEVQSTEQHHHHHHGYSHTHGHSFDGPEATVVRFHRALNHLTRVESTALALVIGVGLGSIVHLLFMVCLLSFRRMRYTCKAKREESKIRLEGEEAVLVAAETLPAYEEAQHEELDLSEKGEL
ncbi:hypothetical protein IAR55_006608 [Kwoniella newhampshirensis]|uniref:Uncharacterized protein n=1 Tax=Kwoniella newhampshirensis TaxID=1651941 RepID=A0AAW0YUI5_9TREE